MDSAGLGHLSFWKLPSFLASLNITEDPVSFEKWYKSATRWAEPLCYIRAWGPLGAHTQEGALVTLPWSKAWQPWGVRHSASLRPEQEASLAVPHQPWHLRKPPRSGQDNERAVLAALRQRPASSPKKKQRNCKTPLSPPLPHRAPWPGLVKYTPGKAGVQTQQTLHHSNAVSSGQGGVLQKGDRGADIFDSQRGTTPQLLDKPGVCICCLGTEELLEVFNTNQIHALQEKDVLMKEVSQDA